MGQESFRGDFRGMFLDALRACRQISALSEEFLYCFEKAHSTLLSTAPIETATEHVENCALFAAAFKALSGSGEVEPLQVLGAVIDGYGAQITTYTRSILDQAPNAFRRIVEESKQRERDYFGADFSFEHPRDDADAYHLHI